MDCATSGLVVRPSDQTRHGGGINRSSYPPEKHMSTATSHSLSEPSLITVVAHSGERRQRRPTMQAQAGQGCCCCCCCCLHSVGGLIGALIESRMGEDPTPDAIQQAVQNWDEMVERKAPSVHDPEAVKAIGSISTESPTRSVNVSDGVRGRDKEWVSGHEVLRVPTAGLR
jgi:hypothetical protein